MQKTDLSYLYNCQFHSVLLSEIFKMADFFYFSTISKTAQDILKIPKVLSSWCYKL